MRYLLVKNWRDHQHYKKRSPPWIKLHRAITEDYAFAALKDKTKAHLILIWILAAGSEGKIPHDPAFIAKRINAAESVNIEEMIAAGFLIPDGVDDSPPAPNGANRPVVNNDTGNVIQLIHLNDGSEFEVRESFVLEMEKLYPAVDIRQTLNEMRGYFMGKPQKRKTLRGIRGCIVSWMAREQNKHA